MDGPGMSLFQGSDIKLSNSFQRAEEEEELAEENKKRQAELQDLFKNAFDDLNDDDDDASSVTSSQFSANQSDHDFSNHIQNYNFQPVANFHQLPVFNQPIRESNLEPIPEKHNESSDSIVNVYPKNGITSTETDISGQHYKHCFKKGTNREEDLIENYKKADGEHEELKVLYEVRMREVERLRREVDVEREAKEEAFHQLALSQSDKKKLSMELSDMKQLFSKSKDRISELEESVDRMKSEILDLEKAREKDDEEVKIAQQQVICLEQKIAAMERCDVSNNRMKQMDVFIENLNAKHQKELNSLQNKIDSISEKLELKDGECKALESKLNEVERKRAALVLEKCDGASRQESALQALLNQANEDKVELNRQIVCLQSEIAGLKSDLGQYENVAQLRLVSGSSSDESGIVGRNGPASQLTRTKSSSNIIKSMNPHNQDVISNLRDELHRALIGKAAKRHEINKLQEQVRSKEIQIQEMKERERVYLSQTDSLKADITRIVGQLSQTKDSDSSAAMQQMRAEIDRLLESNKNHLMTIDELNKELMKLKGPGVSIGLRETELAQLKSQTDQLLKAKDMEWRVKLELAMKESDEIKQLYMDLRKNNSRITEQIELQKQQMTLLIKDKDQILSIMKDKEALIDKLREENIKYKVENEMCRSNPNLNLRDRELIVSLEKEIERLKADLGELPKKHTEELESLKNELESAKLRLIELDQRLRKEFENELTKIIMERDKLKELVEKYESSGKSRGDIGISNDPAENDDVKLMKEEMLKLKKNVCVNSDEQYEKRLESELDQLEKRLVAEHKAELASTEDRIKNVMASYYGNHINEIKKHYEEELSKIIANEQKKMLELTQVLQRKENEIQQLKNNNVSDKLTILQKRIEDDRQKFSESIQQWSTQVEQLKKKISDDQNKILYLNQNLKIERKDAQKYKIKFDNAKKIIQKEKLENMLKIKSDFDNLKISNDLDGKRMIDKEKLIEMEYAEKENILKQQFEMSKAIL